MKKEYCPVDELAEMVSSDHEYDRLEAARAPMLVESQMIELANDSDYSVRKALASRPDLTSDAIRAIVSSESETELVSLALRGYKGSELLSELAKNTDCSIRRLAASHEKTSESALLDLATDNHKMVRHALVAREEIPFDVQKILSRDPSLEIRMDLARRGDDLPYVIYIILKEDIDQSVRNIVTE